MRRAGKAICDATAVVLPLASGFLFYRWLEWSPKTWIDPQCGTPDWVVVTYVPFLIVPPVLAGVRARQAGKDWPTTRSRA